MTRRKRSDVLDVTFKLEVLPDTIVVLPRNETGFEETKTLLTSDAWLCCGQSRHFSMPMPRDELGANARKHQSEQSLSNSVTLEKRHVPFARLSRRHRKKTGRSRPRWKRRKIYGTSPSWQIIRASATNLFRLYGWSSDIPTEKNTWFERNTFGMLLEADAQLSFSSSWLVSDPIASNQSTKND